LRDPNQIKALYLRKRRFSFFPVIKVNYYKIKITQKGLILEVVLATLKINIIQIKCRATSTSTSTSLSTSISTTRSRSRTLTLK